MLPLANYSHLKSCLASAAASPACYDARQAEGQPPSGRWEQEQEGVGAASRAPDAFSLFTHKGSEPRDHAVASRYHPAMTDHEPESPPAPDVPSPTSPSSRRDALLDIIRKRRAAAINDVLAPDVEPKPGNGEPEIIEGEDPP